MDISAIKAAEKMVDIIAPNGFKIGTMTLISTLDNRAVKMKSELQRERLEHARKNIEKDERYYENRALAGLITSWDWGKNTFEGKVPECDPAVIMKIFEEHEWFRHLAFMNVADDAAFFPKAG